jgi:hypothetical protein
MRFSFVVCAAVFIWTSPTTAEISPSDALLFLDFEDQSPESVKLINGPKRLEGKFGGALDFRTAAQYAEMKFDGKLDGLKAMSIGGWFFTRLQGEQYFFSRGQPQIGEDATRRFPAEKGWVNFVLGTDQRGFLMGTINGNGSMPFPYVTVNELGIDAWHQVVVVKDDGGRHHFYHNGALVHSSDASSSQHRPYGDKAPGEPVRLQMPQGGLVGETWIVDRAVSAEEVRTDFDVKRKHYHPAHPGRPVALREMNAHSAAGLWNRPITAANWPVERKRIEQGVFNVLGAFPSNKPPLEAKTHGEDEDCGSYIRRKVSFNVQHALSKSPAASYDRMPCWLLVPKSVIGEKRKRNTRVPAIICFYGTTSGAGKDVTVGLSGRAPGTPAVRNLAFAIDMVEAGFVALAPDYLRDGERIKPGRRPYDTTDFYKEFPDWSIHGKDLWDTMRAVDYLETLDFVDAAKIGMTGHSYGGHSTIFDAALEPRIKVAVANGPVSDFLHHGMHWAVPKGGGASQSLPAMRPYALDHTLPLPVTFYEFTSLIAPRPLLVGQAVGEHRPMEEENYAAVREVYAALGQADRVRHVWYAGDHDYPAPMRKAAVEWFRKWFQTADE